MLLIYKFSDLAISTSPNQLKTRWRSYWSVTQVCTILFVFQFSSEYCSNINFYSDCTYQEIALIFEKPSVANLILTWWTSLAWQLEIPPHSVAKLRKEIHLRKFTHTDIVIEILTHWRMRNGNRATLGALYNLFPPDAIKIKGTKNIKHFFLANVNAMRKL